MTIISMGEGEGVLNTNLYEPAPKIFRKCPSNKSIFVCASLTLMGFLWFRTRARYDVGPRSLCAYRKKRPQQVFHYALSAGSSCGTHTLTP